MKRGLVLLCLVSLFGCAKISSDVRDSNIVGESVSTRSGNLSSANGDKARRFTEEMLVSLIDRSSFDGRYTVKTDIKSSSSGCCRASSNGTPSLYVVNFEEGGWMIVAGHVRDENQVLAYSETGVFDPENITNPGVRFWYGLTKEQMENVRIEETEEVVRQSGWPYFVPSWIDMNEPYYWVRLPLPQATEVVDQGYVVPLLNTKWGQGSPWNIMTPSPSSTSYSSTGCVAVSCAQILYYLTISKGFSIGLYDVSGTYLRSWDGANYYYYIDPTSVSRTNYQIDLRRWNGMKRKKVDSEGRPEDVAELMFDIAEHSNMRFYSFGSGAIVSPSIFSNYNVLCDESDYSFDVIRRSLDDRMPVEVSCFPDNGGGHSWVIDGYKVYEERTDNAYQWKLIPPDSLCYYNNIDYDHVFTESHKQANYPELEEYQIDHNYTYYRNNYLLMNWGWDGEYDNAHYSINPDWSVAGYNFWRDARIIHNFRQERIEEVSEVI